MAPRINHLSAMGSFFISFSILCILQMPNSWTSSSSLPLFYMSSHKQKMNIDGNRVTVP
jgi:hypothetical protein